jgi:membrane protein YdbS with pleckstrin-like domain
MESSAHPLNVPFRPSTKFRLWYGITALLVASVIVCSYAVFALAVGLPPVISVVVAVFTVVLLALFVGWTLLYYDSMQYELREDELTWQRGVWFRRTGIVPYNRITNIDIRQGPLMRALGISNLAVQTAGYSGQMVPEIVLEAMEHAEELRGTIRSRVRLETGGDGTGSGGATPRADPHATDLMILDELRRIRTLLEARR